MIGNWTKTGCTSRTRLDGIWTRLPCTWLHVPGAENIVWWRLGPCLQPLCRNTKRYWTWAVGLPILSDADMGWNEISMMGRRTCGRATVAWRDHQVRLISYSFLCVPIYAGDAGYHVPSASPQLGVPHHLNLKFMQDFHFFFWVTSPLSAAALTDHPSVPCKSTWTPCTQYCRQVLV